MLTAIIFIPLLAALAILFVPRDYRPVLRGIALASTLLTAALAGMLFLKFDAAYKPAAAYAQLHGQFQFAQLIEWLPALGLNYHVGVDGLNIGLILMGAIVAFAAVCVSWGNQIAGKGVLSAAAGDGWRHSRGVRVAQPLFLLRVS